MLLCSSRNLQTVRICSNPFPTPQPNSPAASSSESHRKQRSSWRAPVAGRPPTGATTGQTLHRPCPQSHVPLGAGGRRTQPFCALLPFPALRQPRGCEGPGRTACLHPPVLPARPQTPCAVDVGAIGLRKSPKSLPPACAPKATKPVPHHLRQGRPPQPPSSVLRQRVRGACTVPGPSPALMAQ